MICKSIISVGSIQNNIQNENSYSYIVNGVIRRLSMLEHSFLKLINIAAVNQTNPLQGKEINAIEVHLNSILVNIQGIIDCFLWAVLYHKGVVDPLPFEKKPSKVQFNWKYFNELSVDKVFIGSLLSFNDWLKELKLKGNAAAHRIPFYVPPFFAPF